jgi:hypothetical protein
MKCWERGSSTMKGIYKAFLAFAVIALASGCSSLWEREIYSRSPHIAQEDAGLSAAALTVNSYDTLKSAIIGVIRDGENEADIRVTDYPGELTSPDISRLINEIQRWEPIGAYAVDHIAILDFHRVLSQYIITLRIVYRHDIRPDIIPVIGRRELEEVVNSALRDHAPLLTAEMRYFYARDHDAERMVRDYYYGNPHWAMEYPGVDISIYPPSGDSLSRIIEMALDWQTPVWELTRMRRRTETQAELLLSDMPIFGGSPEEADAQAIFWLYDILRGMIAYHPETDPFPGSVSRTAYGALVNNQAVSEGFAMAFKMLCDMSGIDALVISGLYRGSEHAWNLVRIGSHWYHISIAPGYVLLSDDDELMEAFYWEKTQYPTAAPGPWTEEIVRGPEGLGE